MVTRKLLILLDSKYVPLLQRWFTNEFTNVKAPILFGC